MTALKARLALNSYMKKQLFFDGSADLTIRRKVKIYS